MNFLLKIIEGPNKGAEIALPEGVSVTLGKSDECDIVLADNTLPGEPIAVEANGTEVSVGGEPVEPFHVKTIGATSFAFGPADGPWGELKWPEREDGSREESAREESSRGEAEKRGEEAEEGKVSHSDTKAQSEKDGEEDDSRDSALPREKKHGCLGCFVVLLLLFAAIAVLGWFFREQAKPHVEKAKPYLDEARPYVERLVSKASGIFGKCGDSCAHGEEPVLSGADTIASLVERYGLVLTNRAGRVVLVGDFATRAERLSVTARAYAAQPGVELDFCDNESLRTAAEDTFALVGENDLRVEAATNRIAVLSGTAGNLRRALEALSADLPKLRNVDCAQVIISRGGTEARSGEPGVGKDGFAKAGVKYPRGSASLRGKASSLPVCGIMTTPYPCLVLRNGARVMEGAPFGDGIILKIEADSVTLTNSTGRFTWKP